MEKEHLPSEGSPEGRELAAVSYLWVFSVIVLLAKRDNEFIQHHARRGFVLFLVSVLLWAFPFLHYGEFAVLILSMYGFVTAAVGNENPTPILSEIADGTLRFHHFRHYWHHGKHGVIRIVKPDHAIPALQREIIEQEKELKTQENLLDKEKRMLDMEEKKLSSMYTRMNEDENRIRHLEDEVHILEGEVEKMRK
ncbi:hypothetical protein KKA33_00855 [Patescibacteria group bacterium]|nr:hypothetical protein [Patescibacteria group bacterium]